MKKVLMLSFIVLLLGAVALPQTVNAQSEPFVGQLMMVGFDFCPQGWLPCNGQLLQIAQYSVLFSLLGTNYGGDGVKTFGLPDLQSRVPLGQGQGTGLSAYELGQKGGQETVTLTQEQMPAHNHHLFASSGAAASPKPGGNALANTQNTNIYSTMRPAAAMNAYSIGAAGEGKPFDIRQPYMTINYCIAAQGVFPSRE